MSAVKKNSNFFASSADIGFDFLNVWVKIATNSYVSQLRGSKRNVLFHLRSLLYVGALLKLRKICQYFDNK